MAEPRLPAVELEGIAKTFGTVIALRDVSLTVGEGEFVCFLGPSGCGKTTLLRIIAGLERQNVGVVRMAGRDVSRLPPSQRNYGIVFQSYALFPNLTVARNVAYGLEARRAARREVEARVSELLELVDLPKHRLRYPSQLSGGEQQRVALARALAPAPSLLLLDEPLSALDARVRLALRQEMKALQRRLGITTIMVTHDQDEALTMADRIVVMNHGVVEQIGTPAQIYGEPSSLFVARFVGRMNLLEAVADARPGWARLGSLTLHHRPLAEVRPGGPVTLGIRPEEVRIGAAAREAENRLMARVTSVQFQGAFTRVGLRPEGDSAPALECDLAATALAELDVKEGTELPVALAPGALRAFVAAPAAG
ncbi:MAG TPA: putative 2-aminoethylphosphonate ABC transporter ATP-binding protein [Candidatus Acidoferrum sp.]|jgi:iron(III) transport system ATP-binding protein|nr:putative 2-aminoethylphosphonate ABC transporter ATP-binding protein [Candidatus Acidoferrum sp.]